jgi:molecular chaperone DnaK (HSP70)
MPGRLAIDFGTSNTVLAVWDEERKDGVPLFIPEYSHTYRQGAEEIAVVPSIIHYSNENQRWIGSQVLQRNLYHSRQTFRWMKRYISQRSPIKVQVNGREITPFTAGRDFLSTLLLFASNQLDLRGEEIALSVPVESFEHYENWLATVAESAGILRFRLIDEPSAAALGYGTHIQPGHVYLIFDFGGGTLHASVILMETEPSSKGGRRCRVLGKAGKFIGGSSIDQWIFQEVLRQNNRQDFDEPVRLLSNALLVACEGAKEQLSYEDQAAIRVTDPTGATTLAANLTRAQFEEVLDKHDLFAEINRTVRSALNTARERGYNEDHIQAVLMVGGSSTIPSVQRTLRQFFGSERVSFHRPLDAVARGAAAFVAGVDFYDHIQHDYAIRFVNPTTRQYDYRVIVQRGTPYPTPAPVARLAVKASYDGQNQLGLAIFEMAEARAPGDSGVEIVFDPSGAARIMQITPNEAEQRSLFWMNESNPTFLSADPPAARGEPRFEVEFCVDANKRLTINVRDMKNGQLTHSDYPVVKLT